METEYNDGAHMEIPIHHQIGNRSKPTSLYSLLSMFTFILLLIIIILIILVSLAVVVALFFLPRPKKPVFVVEAIHLRSIDLNISSIKHQLIYLPPFTVSMSFATTNPNNFAITYSSTELHVFYSDSPVGVIRVPTFYQPPHRDHGNTNISFSIHATIYRQQRFNLTQLVVDIGNQNSSTEFRVVGCVPLGVSKIDNFLPLPLPVIKVINIKSIASDFF